MVMRNKQVWTSQRAEPSAVSRLIRESLSQGFRQAYRHTGLDPEKYLRHVRRMHGLPIESWKDIHGLDETLLQQPAASIIGASSKIAALEGLGLGLGGFSTILPDMGILAAITLRMMQKLSLIHGFEYSTEEEVAGLWLAVASAAGIDLAREYLEKQAAEKIVPRIIDRVAVKLGAEVAEKWTGRLLPVVSSGIGGAVNYCFVRSWGRRAQQHFIERHRQMRGLSFVAGQPLLPASS